jgi:3-methyladenine DNA glycosylase/8-oxoguanine DNA glycosylase
MKYLPAAVRHLKRADPRMRKLIERLGPCGLADEHERNQFGALVDAILYQQLAYRAAQTIARRFRMIYASPNGAKAGRLPRPDELLRTPVRKLRAAGVSRQKAGYLRDLARKATAGKLRLGRFGRMSDDEVIENLTQVKGIGRWTAEMFLMFSLGRPDVLPVDDLGVQYGFKDAYGLRKLPSESWMRRTAEPWRPYRSVATWYLWKLRRVNTNADR